MAAAARGWVRVGQPGETRLMDRNLPQENEQDCGTDVVKLLSQVSPADRFCSSTQEGGEQNNKIISKALTQNI